MRLTTASLSTGLWNFECSAEWTNSNTQRVCASMRAKEMNHSGTTQSAHSPRATRSGWYVWEENCVWGMKDKVARERECECVCVCVCVCVYTNRTQVRHLVDQRWQGSPQIVLDLWERKITNHLWERVAVLHLISVFEKWLYTGAWRNEYLSKACQM